MAEPLPRLPTPDELFDEFPCGLVVTNTAGLILKVNRTLCDWTGHEAAELVELRTLQSLFTMGGRIFHQTHWLPMLHLQGSVSEVKLELRCKSGGTVPAMFNAIRRHRESGSFDEVSVTIAEDRNKYERELLIARKRADEGNRLERVAREALRLTQSRLLLALQVGAVFVWGIDVPTGRRRFDDDVARLLGCDGPRPVSDTEFLAAIVPEDREPERRALAAALSPDSGPNRWTFRLDGIDGVQRIVVSSGNGFFGADGSLSEFVGVLSDVTDATRQQAAARDRALFAEQMVGIVSHDLRNPLSAILLGTQMLERGIDLGEAKRRRLLANVAGATKRARRLIDDLLDFTAARIGTGVAVVLSPVDLHPLVAHVVDELRLSFPGRELVHRSSGAGPCSADADRLAQLIGNLVGNAFSYGTPGSVVSVTSVLVDGVASVGVHNDGESIPEEVRALIFEPMIRGVGAKNVSRGVGLGLFIVQAIARAHGGRVDVTSSTDAGTEFRFKFPAR